MGAAIRAAFPQFAVSDDDRAFLDLWGGYLRPEACVETQLRLAELRHRADFRRGVTVESIRSSKTGVTLTAEDGEMLRGRSRAHHGRRLAAALPARRAATAVHRHASGAELVRDQEPRGALFAGKLSGVHLGRQRPQAAESRRRPKAVVYGFPLAGGADGGLKVTHEEVGPDHRSRSCAAQRHCGGDRPHLYDLCAALPAGPRSALHSDGDLPLHQCRGRALRHRHASRTAARHLRLGLLGPWLQAFGRGRGSAGRADSPGHAPSHVNLAPFTLKRLEAFLAKT